MLRFVGFKCTTVLLPDEARGVELKSKFPHTEAYADSDGLRLLARNRFSVIWTCGIKQSHSFAGNLVSHKHKPVIK